MTRNPVPALKSMSDIEPDGALSRLTIDLGAIRANYRRLSAALGDVPCAGVVKANAYGLGVERVAPVLWDEGCRIFFTATLPEAVEVRAILPKASVAVLNGLVAGTEAIFVQHDIIPVLGDLEQITNWRTQGGKLGRKLPAMLHVDTGMSRTGLDAGQWDRVVETPDVLDGIDWLYLMSHLSCADEPEHPMNRAQLERFNAIRTALPRSQHHPMKSSLANSAGILLDPAYHFDLGRPGIGLYGGRPRMDRPNPHACPIRLEGRVMQVRTIAPGTPVSYGAGWRAERETRVATIGAGYADGYLRSLSGKAEVSLSGTRCPVIGRVTMDMIMVDVTDLPETVAHPGAFAELMGPEMHPDTMADAAGTISYELLTSLGTRYARRYIDTGPNDA
jgi:alanine racemase